MTFARIGTNYLHELKYTIFNSIEVPGKCANKLNRRVPQTELCNQSLI